MFSAFFVLFLLVAAPLHAADSDRAPDARPVRVSGVRTGFGPISSCVVGLVVIGAAVYDAKSFLAPALNLAALWGVLAWSARQNDKRQLKQLALDLDKAQSLLLLPEPPTAASDDPSLDFRQRIDDLRQWSQTFEGEMFWRDYFATRGGQRWLHLFLSHMTSLYQHGSFLTEPGRGGDDVCDLIVRLDSLTRILSPDAPISGAADLDWELLSDKANRWWRTHARPASPEGE